jgi:hypothetical protein
MKKLIDKFLGPKEIAAFKSYLRALLAAGITMGIALLTDLKPEYAVLIGALAAPLAKWADKNEKEYGRGSAE